MAVKERDLSLDFMKVIATLMVLNSHMGVCYAKFSALATGGAIGDTLFFFVSGFALLLGTTGRFDNWYKRRLSRILPAVIITAILTCVLWGNDNNIVNILLCKGDGYNNYWFIGCILIYYVLLYPIKMYNKHYIPILVVSAITVTVSWFVLYNEDYSLFYGVDLIFRKIFYFLIFLEGAIVGKYATKEFHWWHVLMLAISIIGWYGIVFLTQGTIWQLSSAIPMMGIPYFLYKTGQCGVVKKMFNNKVLGQILFIIGSLCLECYLIQFYLISDQFNSIFPLNIPLVMVFVLVASYVIHSLAEIFRQIFDSAPMDWSKVLLWRK